MKTEFFLESNRQVKLTKKEVYSRFPNLKEDIENEIKEFRRSDYLSTKVSYKEGLGLWMERTLDEVGNANEKFQKISEQVEGLKKKETVQKQCH